MEQMEKQPVGVLRHVGKQRTGQYRRLGVETLEELLRLYPRTYEDWSQPFSIAKAPADRPVCVAATVLTPPKPHYIRQNMTLFRFSVSDGTDKMEITLFNAAYTARKLIRGGQYLFFGTVTRRGALFEMSAPQIQSAETGGYIRPVYPQTAGLTSRMIETNVKEALAVWRDAPPPDCIPEDIRQEYRLCDALSALQNIHFPADAAVLRAARRRLVFEELFVLRLGLFCMRRRSRTQTGARLQQDCTAAYLAGLPFTLTGAQRRAIAAGIADMQGSCPMSRLIQGDVGSGKTAVAAGLMFSAAKNGLQTALMAPTDILARQHAASLRRLLGSDIRVELLTGSLPAAEKRRVHAALQDGSADVVIGTHALLSDTVQFARLGLVITDEQHRFGVAQRAALAAKGIHPHLLVMSATPIPRTLALLAYGDLDVSILDELPPGRQPVSTYAVDTAKRERVYAFIRKHAAAGRQAYIVCPLVEDGDNDELVAASSYFRDLQNGALRGISVALLHGQMSAKEKDTVMTAFAAGEIAVLVSTVVIEVGVDVPNAVLMVIENADRFGLAQLHQLRGRVGRGEHPSTCVLISDAAGKDAVERLRTLCRTNDGFRIAEEDLRMRGPGDFFGSRQHGLPQLRIADLAADMTVLEETAKAVTAVTQQDPALTAPEHRALAAAVSCLFADNMLN